MQPQITLYTKTFCPYCIRAKMLLKSKNVKFSEIEITGKPNLKAEMIELSNGGWTVPQIFISDKHIGGASELFALNNEGKLDPLLNLIDG